MRAPQDPYTYYIKCGNKILHTGITHDLERHQQAYQRKIDSVNYILESDYVPRVTAPTLGRMSTKRRGSRPPKAAIRFPFRLNDPQDFLLYRSASV